MADPISTLPDGSPLTDQFKVPLTAVTTDQQGNAFADTVTWALDDTANATLVDVTDTSCSVHPGDFAAGSQVTITATATDPAGLTASQVIVFTGSFTATAAAISITAGTPEPK